MASSAQLYGPLGRGFDLAQDEESEGLDWPVRTRKGADGSAHLEWSHPGRGEGCGIPEGPAAWWAHRVAPGVIHVNPISAHCDSFDCPTHWRSGWLRREANHLTDVLIAQRAERIEQGKSRGIVHFSVNPPPDLMGSSGYRDHRSYAKMRAKASKIVYGAGLEMFSLTPHHERCADRADPCTTDGLHFHGLGFGWVKEDQFAKSGWVVRNHGARLGRRSLVATARYFLSHASRLTAGILLSGKSGGSPMLTVTWYGRSKGLKLPKEGRFCKVCKLTIPERDVLKVYQTGTEPPPEGPAEVAESDWVVDVHAMEFEY
jgi:hypothetical protein